MESFGRAYEEPRDDCGYPRIRIRYDEQVRDSRLEQSCDFVEEVHIQKWMDVHCSACDRCGELTLDFVSKLIVDQGPRKLFCLSAARDTRRIDRRAGWREKGGEDTV